VSYAQVGVIGFDGPIASQTRSVRPLVSTTSIVAVAVPSHSAREGGACFGGPSSTTRTGTKAAGACVRTMPGIVPSRA